MTEWKESEKEIIRAIVKYDGKEKTLAKVLNKSKLLENRGLAIVQYGVENIIFLRNDMYDAPDNSRGLGYIAELMSLIDTLIKRKLIVMIPFCTDNTLVIGAEESKWLEPEIISVNGVEKICVAERHINWVDAGGRQKYMHCALSEQKYPMGGIFNMAFAVSQELEDLAKNDFKSEEDVRFRKQQWLTWISIAVAATIGILGIIF
ncbi:MAG: hypothetical protein IKN94_12310 [Salinivirgaceae bacterium]|nr:hypothetical protein [Salinivirgaceae bacterium]